METVSEICRKTGVTRKQLFYYDKIDLLKPTKRVGPQKAKLYGPKAVERLDQILLYQKAGLHLSEIREILECSDEEKAAYLLNVIQRLEAEQAQLSEKIQLAKELCASLENIE